MLARQIWQGSRFGPGDVRRISRLVNDPGHNPRPKAARWQVNHLPDHHLRIQDLAPGLDADDATVPGENPVDPAVGLGQVVRLGTALRRGQPLAVVHAARPDAADRAARAVRALLRKGHCAGA